MALLNWETEYNTRSPSLKHSMAISVHVFTLQQPHATNHSQNVTHVTAKPLGRPSILISPVESGFILTISDQSLETPDAFPSSPARCPSSALHGVPVDGNTPA